MGFADGYKTYDTSNGFGSRRKWESAFEERMNLRNNSKEETEKSAMYWHKLTECKNQAELKTTYRDLMKKYHPDVAGDTEENKIIAQAINDMYFKIKAEMIKKEKQQR